MTLTLRRCSSLLMVLAVLTGPRLAQGQDLSPLLDNGHDYTFDIKLWPDGIVLYKFIDPIDPNDKIRIEAAIRGLNEAFKLPDPARPALENRMQYVFFQPCDGAGQPQCGPKHLEIRNNVGDDSEDDDSENTCRYYPEFPHVKGYNPDGLVLMRIKPPSGGTHQGPNTIAHELLHCLGVWHEQNRNDTREWLIPQGAGINEDAISHDSTSQMPLLGNFDYDSIMLYGSSDDDGNMRYLDRSGNAFKKRVRPGNRHPVEKR